MNFRLSVLVNPNSSRCRARWRDDFLKINLTSPPVEGQANEELLDFLEDLFDLKAGDVQLLSGAAVRRKTVQLRNLERERLVQTLQSLDNQD